MKFPDRIIEFFQGWKRRNGQLKFWQTREERVWLRWIIAGVLVIILVPMFPRGRSLQFADMTEGSISTRRIVAPYDFEILKTPEELQVDRDLAVQKTFPIFIIRDNKITESIRNVDAFFEEAITMRSDVLQNSERIPQLQDSLFQKYPISVLDTLYMSHMIDPAGPMSNRALRNFQSNIKKIIRDLLAVGVLNVEKQPYMNPDRRLIVRTDEGEVIQPFDDFYDLTDSKAKAAEMLNNDYLESIFFEQMGFAIVSFFILPNLIYDEEMHIQRVSDTKSRVPVSSGFVYYDELIVDKNQRITPDIRKKLGSLATIMVERGMQEGGIKRLFPTMGKVAFVVALFFLFGVYFAMEDPGILKETRSIFLVALIVFLVSILTFFIHRLDASEYLVPTALGAILLATLFDTKIGFAGTAIISVLVGGLWGNEFNLMFVSFFVGVVGVVTINRVRTRNQLFQSVFYLIGAYIFAISFMGFFRFLTFNEILKQWQWGALNGLLTPIVAYGMLALIESLFDITTDFSLLELSNLNHPLLKRLSLQAPGTYHHSIIVGNLAETAAQAVGANSLLARVGSYYHDVGKLEKAEYFVENQISGGNPHEKLTPRMSALILMNHVKRGLELGEKYKLPSSIKHIISQHQGTTVMSFFYRKAQNKSGIEDANEEDYRYPGPRPQTKEAAIVMMADAVEAATRSLKDPTHSRIKGLIDDLVDARFKEGQLDESPLTLRDLERIKEGFLTILAGTFHARLEYPEKDEDKEQAKDQDRQETVAKI